MPHIFRFHKGKNNNIYDWKASDKIEPADVREVLDKTNILTSSAGTSIPTPMARMHLFKTAFEIMAAQVREKKSEDVDKESIYAGLVSETLDLLELLYKSGSDVNKFRYQKWTFDNTQQDDNVILNFFGIQHGHRLLAESFKQAASQPTFNNKIEITLIYYREESKEVLVGGTSPFTFVFTSPNFTRKLRERGFKPISGLVSNDILFDFDYKQLHERDNAFIKYVQSLINTEGISNSFSIFSEYVINTQNRNHQKFNGTLGSMQNIQFDDTPLTVNNIVLKQLSQESYKSGILNSSDFKIELPEGTFYIDILTPLFLLDKMPYEGQYSSTTNFWSPNTRISEIDYAVTTLDEVKERELPGTSGFNYPFFTSFDFFEKCLVKLPGYTLNDERFLCLEKNQTYLFPIKPIFFHLFPIQKIRDYLSIETKNEKVTFILKVPVYGPTKGRREFVCRKTYDADNSIDYSGILGIFPFTKTSLDHLLHINKYTVASYEKTNVTLIVDNVKFYKKTGINFLAPNPVLRSNYKDMNTKTTYFQINESFEIIQLNFRKDNVSYGGVIIPLFREVTAGTEEYIYAIDFGTSNTHVEYGRVVDGKLTETQPFSINEASMQMLLLHKPKEVVVDDGQVRYNDYERSMGFDIETARKVTLREFVPFQIGNQPSATVKFPFRTATCESNNFIANQSNNRLFLDANIGFIIDEDALFENVRYKTDLKWLLDSASNDPFNINRVSLFFRQLLLMIRTKVLLEEDHLSGEISKLKITLSFPISMGVTLRRQLKDIFEIQKKEILGSGTPETGEVTESLAPYSQLKYLNPNIQNDSYCNIDIGGGTTDIVLIDKNPADPTELFCYCSSFKFAGRQLWGSGSNAFNLADNGFVSFYKKFIETSAPNIYSELQRILNGNASKTEDVVGLLFSKPEYRFKDIFSEKKGLRVVLLIHYSAILYYITKLAKFKNVALPRTISFSGKGSEYLSLIFPTNHDLKGYTKKVLGIFSGTSIRNDFSIERSKDPKAITAKGSVHFTNELVKENNNDVWDASAADGSDEKRLTLLEINYKGFNDQAQEESTTTYGHLLSNQDKFNDILGTILDFFNLLFDNQELSNIIIKQLEIKDFSKYKEFFVPVSGNVLNEGELRDSLKATLEALKPADNITDAPFFFALNYSLIALSKKISKTN